MVYFGGGGGGVTPAGNTDFTGTISVLDGTKFKIKNQGDPTKIIQFSAASITAATTRTITVPDTNVTLATTAAGQTFTGNNTFNATGAAGSTVFTSVDHDTVKITSGTAGVRTGAYIQNAAGNGIQGIWIDNDRGLFAAACSLQTGASAAAGTLFGVPLADASYLFSAGASSTGMLIGTTTSDPLTIGTNDTARVTIGATGSLALERTITAAGTTGDRTIDKMSGTVNIAGTGTTVTVTNNLVTANSIIYAVLRTADATARIANVVPGAGSFVINIVACTNEVSIGFLVTN